MLQSFQQEYKAPDSTPWGPLFLLPHVYRVGARDRIFDSVEIVKAHSETS